MVVLEKVRNGKDIKMYHPSLKNPIIPFSSIYQFVWSLFAISEPKFKYNIDHMSIRQYRIFMNSKWNFSALNSNSITLNTFSELSSERNNNIFSFKNKFHLKQKSFYSHRYRKGQL